jgi:sec-independent protein translocase protein TatA
VVVGDILQPTHLLFVLVVALLVLGPKRLPEVGRSLGRTMRDFRAAMSGQETHDQLTVDTAPQPPPPAPVPEPTAAAPEEHPPEPAEVPVTSPGDPAATERHPTPTP